MDFNALEGNVGIGPILIRPFIIIVKWTRVLKKYHSSVRYAVNIFELIIQSFYCDS